MTVGNPLADKDTVQALDEQALKSRSFWGDALAYILRDKLTMLAIIILLLMSFACFAGPAIIQDNTDIDPNRTSIPNRYASPGEAGYILGADDLGRDELIRLLIGGRISLLIAYGASLITITIGVTLGLVAGYYGGIMDDAIVWAINTLSAIPAIFLLLIIASRWEPSPEALVVVLALIGWVPSCRLVRAEVFALKERDYIIAARALGSSAIRIMIQHMLPNILSVVIVSLTINAGTLILVESALSYLGIGVQPPTPSWGNMLTESRTFTTLGPHLVFFPGVMITITVLCFYLFGDGLRDALDPRTTRKA